MADSPFSSSSPLILVLDIGTSGIKGLLFTPEGDPLGRAHAPLSKSRPQPGWVEQAPDEIIAASEQVLREVVATTGVDPARIAACGLANQRETVIAWDAVTGRPLYPAIVWQDERTRVYCDSFGETERLQVSDRTGLAVIPYFSASKLRWLLENVPAVRDAANSGRLRFGTVDTWALWNLCTDRPHVTDPTNASRTLLYDIRETLDWDAGLLNLFGVPRAALPAVSEFSSAPFGTLRPEIVGAAVPVRAVLGDQQSSMYAAGTTPGTTKVTYGTGVFMMQALGSTFHYRQPCFTTLAAGPVSPWYALELKVGEGAERVTPALGHPDTLRAVLARIAAEVNTCLDHLPTRPQKLLLDGGISQAGELLRILQEEATGIPCTLQKIPDGTALGAGLLAATAVGLRPSEGAAAA